MKKQISTLNGAPIYRYTFENDYVKVSFMNLGAVLTNLWVKDKYQKKRDVVLGYQDIKQYEKNTNTYFGSTVGRCCNRTANAAFQIEDHQYNLGKNDGLNNLHSGPDGYQLRVWTEQEYNEQQNKVTFALLSEEGDQGYPGELAIEVTYTLLPDGISISYSGLASAKTLFNPTNHSYFNLNGHGSGSILTHQLQLNASAYTPIAAGSIPTGEIVPVKDTPFDFTIPKEIGSRINDDDGQLKLGQGYDHNFVLDQIKQPFATVAAAESGITMRVATDRPGVQFYSGNFLEAEPGKAGQTYHYREGFCLETQYFPNAINEPNFPSPLIEANEQVDTITSYRFTTE
jgi:aldose 1-epimerase